MCSAKSAHGLPDRRRRRRPRLSWHNVSHLCVCLTLLCAWILPRRIIEAVRPAPAAPDAFAGEASVDETLRRAAAAALGTRAGTVVAIDSQTGRLRAVINEQLAFTTPLPPGSTIKPFTTLAALRAGLIDDDSRLLCREYYRRGQFAIHCPHPQFKPPFDPAAALAYSCNYYFSKLGERLGGEIFTETLVSFGFGTRTGGSGGRHDEEESAGSLPHRRGGDGGAAAAAALGEGGHLLVTPAQLITAYAALVNGGRLLTLRAAAHDLTPRERGRLDIAPAHRALLLEGMRGAIGYGTAARAGLGSLPQEILGKTGTSTRLDDSGTHGWFVGFAFEQKAGEDEDEIAAPSPQRVRLSLLVFLESGTGAESAEVARAIFEQYFTVTQQQHIETAARRRDAKARADRPAPAANAVTGTAAARGEMPSVRIHAGRSSSSGGVINTLALDEYIFGVLAAEASLETEVEALKAQAVVSRTFALKNLGRHRRAGYDLCRTTHCQRYIDVEDSGARPEFYVMARRAVAETAGEILRDGQGRVADAYFSAACGGATANIESLWGTTTAAAAPRHLRGGADSFCGAAAAEGFRNWTNLISETELIRALRADSRTDVGGRLDRIAVIRRDTTGRAALLALDGARRRLVRGWDFKIIVGRTLGWNVLKSTRFVVERVGASFIFRGSGFGHGLGLCQAGAHVMGRRGAPYRQILNYYLPGTSLARVPLPEAAGHAGGRGIEVTAGSEGDESGEPETSGSEFRFAAACAPQFRPAAFAVPPLHGSRRHRVFPPRRLTLASEYFRVSYSARVARGEIERVLDTLEAARRDVANRLAAAALGAAGGFGRIELFIHETTGDFVGATGTAPWVAAVTRGHRIDLQPLDVLRRRRVVATTLRHEYAHLIIDTLGRGRTPRWLAEGLAAHIAGEGPLLLAGTGRMEDFGPDELERRLARPAASAPEMRMLYAAAYRRVSALILREGEAGVWRRIAAAAPRRVGGVG